jgi:5-methyltetrahydrofolate--homocysteine methyltransferase
VFRLVRRLREELRVNTTCGASNVAFGLPNRHALSATFLSMAIASGMTSAITNPLHEEIRQAVAAADVLMGVDRDCASWIGRYSERAAPGGEGRRRGGRAGRRGPVPAVDGPLPSDEAGETLLVTEADST